MKIYTVLFLRCCFCFIRLSTVFISVKFARGEGRGISVCQGGVLRITLSQSQLEQSSSTPVSPELIS